MRERTNLTPLSIFTRLVLVVAVLLVSAPGHATSVSVDASSPEVFVGGPFTVTVTIEFEESYEPTRLPDVAGLEIVNRSAPMTSSQVTIINGETTRTQSVRWDFTVVAERAGVFTIPSFAVTADGATMHTKPLRVIASETETTDRLFVEVVSERSRYYLGERVDLTLEIWLRPFRSRSFDVTFSYEQLWQAIDQRRSRFGVFGEDRNSIKVREDVRLDGDGVQRAYYVYMIERKLSPVRAGEVTFDDIFIHVEYPERLRQGRGFFGDRRIEIASTIPLSSRVDHEPITITEPPVEGRPALFNGAIGRFELQVAVEPTEVLAGDPITLTMTVTDLTGGDVQLELLPAPPLERLPELAEQFRIPADPLAGVVEGSRKTFTQTIRPRSADVVRIPPIPLVSFDPVDERYETVESDPIEITVRPVDSLSVSEIVVGDGPEGAEPTQLTEVAGGILANYSGPDLLASHRPFRLGWWQLVLIALPAGAFVVTAVAQRRLRRLRDDRAFARRRSARRRALRRLTEAQSCSGEGHPAAIALALGDYIADRCNLPPGTLTRDEAITRLRDSEVSSELVSEVDAVLEECERLQFGAGNVEPTAMLGQRAARCVDRLERERLV
jgi:hypothetical protein